MTHRYTSAPYTSPVREHNESLTLDTALATGAILEPLWTYPSFGDLGGSDSHCAVCIKERAGRSGQVAAPAGMARRGRERGATAGRWWRRRGEQRGACAHRPRDRAFDLARRCALRASASRIQRHLR